MHFNKKAPIPVVKICHIEGATDDSVEKAENTHFILIVG